MLFPYKEKAFLFTKIRWHPIYFYGIITLKVKGSKMRAIILLNGGKNEKEVRLNLFIYMYVYTV